MVQFSSSTLKMLEFSILTNFLLSLFDVSNVTLS